MNKAFFRVLTTGIACLMLLAAGCGGSAGSLTAALALVEEGKYGEAVPLLEKATRSSPDSATAWCNLGVCYLEQGKTGEAVDALRKAVGLASGSSAAYEYLAHAYVEAGKLDDAREALATADTIDPGNPRILTALGMIEMKAGNLKQAFASTMEALDKDSSYPPALYNIAVLYRDKLNNSKLAEKFFRRFLTAAPSDPRAAEARDFLDPQASVRESPAKGLVEKAKRHMDNDDYDTALVILRDALKKDPGYPDAVWNMAVLSDHVLGNADEAAGFYADFRAKFPNDARSEQAQRRADAIKAELARTAAAVAAAVKAAPSDPVQVTSAPDALAAGALWQKKGDLAKAEAFYKKAIELDETMAEAFSNLGLIYFKSRNYEGARTALASAVDLKSDYTDARYVLANSQYRLGDKAGAVDNLNHILLKQPDFADAHYLMGQILREEKQLAAAKIHLDRHASLTGRVIR